jgi:hypothetical protein
MHLPPKAIEEFCELWHSSTGEVLDREVANVQALKLLNVLEAVFRDESSTRL